MHTEFLAQARVVAARALKGKPGNDTRGLPTAAHGPVLMLPRVAVGRTTNGESVEEKSRNRRTRRRKRRMRKRMRRRRRRRKRKR